MSEPQIFELGDFPLRGGMTLKKARISYQTYGALSADADNVIVYPTSYGAQHKDIEWLIRPDGILNPDDYFVIIPNMFTNGLSTSPSNVAFPYDQGRFPLVTVYDNVRAQKRLLEEAFGIDRIRLVYGWSMGAMQAFHWGAMYPDAVERICAVCGAAKTSPHNKIFLEGVIATLTADAAYQDGWFRHPPTRGLRAMARVYAGWALSQAFYRDALWRDLGFATVEDFLVAQWEGNFRRRDANDLLAQLQTWMHGDISANPLYEGDLERALGAIKARSYVMPCEKDLYFRRADSAAEVERMPNAELRTLDSPWGHRAGNPMSSPEDFATLQGAVRELLSS